MVSSLADHGPFKVVCYNLEVDCIVYHMGPDSFIIMRQNCDTASVKFQLNCGLCPVWVLWLCIMIASLKCLRTVLVSLGWMSYIKHKKVCFITYLNTEK